MPRFPSLPVLVAVCTTAMSSSGIAAQDAEPDRAGFRGESAAAPAVPAVLGTSMARGAAGGGTDVADVGHDAGSAASSASAASAASMSSEAAAERAEAVLGRHVERQSHPSALRSALRAYYAYAAAHPDEVRNPYFFYVDYGLDNRTPRGYVFDMSAVELVEGPFTVAHGRGSSTARNGVPTRFSNRSGSHMSSLGLYVAQETYGFRGKSGGRAYRSVGLRLKGVSGAFNSAARRRGIVSHGAPYVTARDAGRSQGCPAMEQARADRLLPKLANGGLVFLFSPRDARWLREDPWIGVAAGE